MAFFGLTGLGSQSPFEVVKETPLHAFDRADFQDAFMRTWRPGFSLFSESEEEAAAARDQQSVATIAIDRIADVLRTLYKCPDGVDNIPKVAREIAEHECAACGSATLSLKAFLGAMDRACKVSEEREAINAQKGYLKDAVTSREFVSNLEMRAQLAKHTRMTRDPQQKILVPVTDSQTLGWRAPTIITERRPTKSCEETRYASAMVKAGVYYY